MKKVEEDKIINEIISSLKNYNEEYIEGSWEKFQKKREQKKKQKVLWLIFSGGIAAIFLLCVIVYETVLDNPRKKLEVENEKTNLSEPKTEDKLPMVSESDLNASYEREIFLMRKINRLEVQVSFDKENPTLASCKESLPDKLQVNQKSNKITVPSDSIGKEKVLNKKTGIIKKINTIGYKTNRNNSNNKKLRFGFLVKQSTNSTSTSSNVSIALGVVNEMELNDKLSFNSGVILDRYNLDYTQVKVYSEHDPTSINAELLCLDIPLNLKIKLFEMKQSDIFISGGVSSLIFLKEKYRQEFIYAEPSETNISCRNINFAGQLNLSSGWQHQISSHLNITIEAYMKIPLYDLAEENLHFYQSGLSIKISK